MTSRRHFLFSLPAYALSTLSFAQRFHRRKPVPPPPARVFVGTDTAREVSKGIYQADFNSRTGQLTVPVLAAVTARPSYLALSPLHNGHRSLYAVNAVPDPSATVTTFDLDQQTGILTRKASVTSAGAGPAYVSVDSTGQSAFVANYVGGTIASYRIQPDGTLSQPVSIFNYREPRFGKHGPVPVRQDGPHPHSVFISPDDRFLIVNDLGNDALSVFLIDTATARLTPSDPLLTSLRPGSGPRHIAFHPNGRWVYLINELDSTIDHLLWTDTHSLKRPQAFLIHTNTTVKTTAPGFPSGKNTAAEVLVSPDGNFLYASNRGEDTLVVFSIQNDGGLKEIQRISCGGKTPRHFTFDPTFDWILCGNQDSASITVFRRDQGNGKLAGPTQTIPVDSPLFTLFV